MHVIVTGGSGRAGSQRVRDVVACRKIEARLGWTPQSPWRTP